MVVQGFEASTHWLVLPDIHFDFCVMEGELSVRSPLLVICGEMTLSAPDKGSPRRRCIHFVGSAPSTAPLFCVDRARIRVEAERLSPGPVGASLEELHQASFHSCIARNKTFS